MTTAVLVIEARPPRGYHSVREAVIKGVLCWMLLGLWALGAEALLQIPFFALVLEALALPSLIIIALKSERRYANYRTAEVPFALLDQVITKVGCEMDPFMISEAHQFLLQEGFSRHDAHLIVSYCLERKNSDPASRRLHALRTPMPKP